MSFCMHMYMTQTGWGCLHDAMLGLVVQDMPRTGSHLHQLAQISNISNGSRECSRLGRKSPHRCISSPAAGCLFAHRITCAICQWSTLQGLASCVSIALSVCRPCIALPYGLVFAQCSQCIGYPSYFHRRLLLHSIQYISG